MQQDTRNTPPSVGSTNTSFALHEPISNAPTRITKKHFGQKVSPKSSPVTPERFAGYHSGTDFEALSDEQDSQVQVFAVCSGTVKLKKRASGYGGVLVQQCTLKNQDVTIVYGHLKLSGITIKVGEKLTAGDVLGVLGEGYSEETDGERKHLHLAIHKGTSTNIQGYVQSQSALGDWIDAEEYL